MYKANEQKTKNAQNHNTFIGSGDNNKRNRYIREQTL